MITMMKMIKINKMNKEQLEEYMISNFDKLSPKLKEQSILRYGEFILKEKGVDNYTIKIQELENSNIKGRCYSKIEN